MSITLTDRAGKSMTVNAWNWGVLDHTLICAKPKLLDDTDLMEQLRSGGVELGKSEAKTIRDHLRTAVLPILEPGERLLADFTVTNEPDDGTLHRDELTKNYSLHYDVLVAVIEFLDRANPPIQVS